MSDEPFFPPELLAALRAEHGLGFAEPPDEASPAEAERECNRLLRALRAVREQIAANQRAHADEVSRADQWLSRVNHTPQLQETWLLNMIEAVAEFVPRFDGKKSRDLPHGVIGWRMKPERIVIEDPVAVLLWAKALALPVETEEKVPHSVIVHEWKKALRRAIEGMEPEDCVPPGCKVIAAEDTFYVEPKDVA